MNYYEHHLGDYLRDTAHLTMLEDGAYRRLLDQYYIRSRPLPADPQECCKLARAISKPEREAVAAVLREFFIESAEGYRHKRCDEEIIKYVEKQPAAVAKREADRERQRRARERRKALFESLRTHGVVMPWDASTEALQEELSRVTKANGHGPVTAPVTAPVTCDNTAIHTPVPNPQSKNPPTPRDRRTAPKALGLPSDFELSEKLRSYAEGRLPNVDPAELFARFCDQAVAKGWTYADWSRAWQTYVRNCAPNSGHWAADQYPRAGSVAKLSTREWL